MKDCGVYGNRVEHEKNGDETLVSKEKLKKKLKM